MQMLFACVSCAFCGDTSAVFCTVCCLFVFVSDIIGDQFVLLYSSVVLVMALYVLSSVSLNFPQ